MIAIAQPKGGNILPAPSQSRIKFLDALRGFALFGVLFMNMLAMGQPEVYYSLLNIEQSTTGANYYTWLYGSLLFAGTMRGIFSLLFGAGSLLLLDRLEKSHTQLAADIYYRRVLWLIAFGLLDSFVFLWWGDVLFFYGVYGLILYPFRKVSPKKLFIPLLISLAFGVYHQSTPLIEKQLSIKKGKRAEQMVKHHHTLDSTAKADLQKWEAMKKRSTRSALLTAAHEEIDTYNNLNVEKMISASATKTAAYQTEYLYNIWPDVLIMFFLGMIMYRSGYLTGECNTWLYVIVAVLGLTLGLGYQYYELQRKYLIADSLRLTAESLPINLYELRRLVQASGCVSLLVLLYRLRPFRWFLDLFAPAGQAAFSNYLFQSVIAITIFYVFRTFGSYERYELLLISVLVFVLQMIISKVWLHFFQYGPFEWIWRSLVYCRIQPFKRI